MEKAPEGLVGNYREQQQEYDRHAPEHVDQRLPSPQQQQHVESHDLPPPLPYGTTTPPTASRTAPRFVTTVNSDRLENGVAHKPSHVGGRHLSPPPHPDTENDGVEAVTGDGDDNEDEDEDDDDIYTDDVHQNLGDHVRPVAAGTETQTVPNVSTGGGPAETETHTVPTVSTGGGPAVEPLATDIHPQDEQEGFGLTEEVHAA